MSTNIYFSADQSWEDDETHRYIDYSKFVSVHVWYIYVLKNVSMTMIYLRNNLLSRCIVIYIHLNSSVCDIVKYTLHKI